MPELFNPSQFPVFVAELGKTLAPYEAIAVEDAEAVARAAATGVLKDVDEREPLIKAQAEKLAKDADTDLDKAEAAIRKALADHVAQWHDEHPKPEADQSPVEDAAEPQEAVQRPLTAKIVQGVDGPVEDRSEGDPGVIA